MIIAAHVDVTYRYRKIIRSEALLCKLVVRNLLRDILLIILLHLLTAHHYGCTPERFSLSRAPYLRAFASVGYNLKQLSFSESRMPHRVGTHRVRKPYRDQMHVICIASVSMKHERTQRRCVGMRTTKQHLRFPPFAPIDPSTHVRCPLCER